MDHKSLCFLFIEELSVEKHSIDQKQLNALRISFLFLFSLNDCNISKVISPILSTL